MIAIVTQVALVAFTLVTSGVVDALAVFTRTSSAVIDGCNMVNN